MKSYLRFLSRNKLYTAIEIVGLSVALAFVIIFTCYVKQQVGVNSYYPGSDKIYLTGIGGTYSYKNMAKELKSLPEIENAVLVEHYFNQWLYEDQVSSQEGVMIAGKDFFDLFTTKFIYGSPDVLEIKTNALVTKSFALRNGMDKVIGKTLVNEKTKEQLVIAGIIDDFTDSVFENFEIIVSNKAYSKGYGNRVSSGIMTFIKVKDGTDINLLKEKISGVVDRFYEGIDLPNKNKALIVRLDNLYFHTANDGMTGLKNENRDRVTIFSCVVLFLLISAIINYVNLNMAKAEKRSKEIAISHIIGASQRQLTFKALYESLVFTSISFMIGLLVACILTEPINKLLQSRISVSISFEWNYIAIYILMIIVIAAICGIAVSQIGFKVRITSSTIRQKSLSKIFMGFQLVISLIMMSVAIIMETQMKYMLERDMYANVDNVYRTNILTKGIQREIKKLPFVRRIGRSTGYPGYFGMEIETDEYTNMSLMICDSTAFRMFDYEIISDFCSGNPIGTWVCESAANHFNITESKREWSSPDPFDICSSNNVTGIIKDTPRSSVISPHQSGLGIINVTTSDKVPWGGLLLEVEETPENKFILDSLVSTIYLRDTGREAFGYGFLNDCIKAEYDKTIRDMRLMEIFMTIAIMLSCLAFLAMSIHYSNYSMKQIAVHKVFGGNTNSELIRNLVVYLKISIASVTIGLPCAIWIGKQYLHQFSYRFNLTDKWWVFLISIAVSLFLSISAVLWQTLRAARTNPAEALKKE